jgi:hypothetical protein
MKVLDLQCGNQHAFEGWFASETDFQSQLARALVACPLCNSTAITKKLSAPRLNLGAASPAETVVPPADAPSATAGRAAVESAWLSAVRHVLAHTEDVGERFAEVARQMHYGETEDRNIRGKATREETEALLDEGIAVLPLPVPEVLKETLQ